LVGRIAPNELGEALVQVVKPLLAIRKGRQCLLLIVLCYS